MNLTPEGGGARVDHSTTARGLGDMHKDVTFDLFYYQLTNPPGHFNLFQPVSPETKQM